MTGSVIFNIHKFIQSFFIINNQVMESFAKAEKRKKPNPTELFKDVYEEIPPHLQKQMDSLKEHLSKNEDKYPTQNYEAWSEH